MTVLPWLALYAVGIVWVLRSRAAGNARAAGNREAVARFWAMGHALAMAALGIAFSSWGIFEAAKLGVFGLGAIVFLLFFVWCPSALAVLAIGIASLKPLAPADSAVEYVGHAASPAARKWAWFCWTIIAIVAVAATAYDAVLRVRRRNVDRLLERLKATDNNAEAAEIARSLGEYLVSDENTAMQAVGGLKSGRVGFAHQFGSRCRPTESVRLPDGLVSEAYATGSASRPRTGSRPMPDCAA